MPRCKCRQLKPEGVYAAKELEWAKAFGITDRAELMHIYNAARGYSMYQLYRKVDRGISKEQKPKEQRSVAETAERQRRATDLVIIRNSKRLAYRALIRRHVQASRPPKIIAPKKQRGKTPAHILREARNARLRESYAKNIEKERQRSRQRRIDHPRYHTDYTNRRRASDPLFDLTCRLRHSINMRLGAKKPGKSDDILRCSFGFFQRWIESQFADGMNWENRNRWHIEHLFPCDACADADDIAKSFFYRNLRPEWALSNAAKRHKITPDGLVSAFICGIRTIRLRCNWQISQELESRALALGFTIIKQPAPTYAN